MTLAEVGWMTKADRISGLLWLVFGVIVSIESRRMGLGTLHRPGPGFLFFWVGISLSVLSLVILIQAWLAQKVVGTGGFSFGKKNITKIFLVLISLFLYALLMEGLGFVVVTLLLFMFLLGIVEKKGWGVTILTSLAVTGAAYLLFEIALKSQLPKGLLGFLRF
jgi:putative tricarboxylic transport membrane protein